MKQLAVFIDAGYFLSEGSKLIGGARIDKKRLSVNTLSLIGSMSPRRDYSVRFPNNPSKLDGLIHGEMMGASLLRGYWYDAIGRNGLFTAEQEKIANAEKFKFRYGYLSSGNQQKGVDALISADMMELARNKAITDAILISGDEDLLLGMQVTQSLGIRVHLIGIEPRSTQSNFLIREADSHFLLSKSEMESYLSILPEVEKISIIPKKSEKLLISQHIQKRIFKLIEEILEQEPIITNELELIPEHLDGELLRKLEEIYNKKPEQFLIDFARKIMRHELRRLYLKS